MKSPLMHLNMHYRAVLAPFLIYALTKPFTATQLSNAIFATKAIQYNPDLLFG